jgi:hypothetical protein
MEAAQKALEEQEQQKVSSRLQRIAESKRLDFDGRKPGLVVSRYATRFWSGRSGALYIMFFGR